MVGNSQAPKDKTLRRTEAIAIATLKRKTNQEDQAQTASISLKPSTAASRGLKIYNRAPARIKFDRCCRLCTSFSSNDQDCAHIAQPCSYLQWISHFHVSSIIESGKLGFPARHAKRLPASMTLGAMVRVLIVTFPSGEVWNEIPSLIWNEGKKISIWMALTNPLWFRPLISSLHFVSHPRVQKWLP